MMIRLIAALALALGVATANGHPSAGTSALVAMPGKTLAALNGLDAALNGDSEMGFERVINRVVMDAADSLGVEIHWIVTDMHPDGGFWAWFAPNGLTGGDFGPLSRELSLRLVGERAAEIWSSSNVRLDGGE